MTNHHFKNQFIVIFDVVKRPQNVFIYLFIALPTLLLTVTMFSPETLSTNVKINFSLQKTNFFFKIHLCGAIKIPVYVATMGGSCIG